jgi:hypothetical protein
VTRKTLFTLCSLQIITLLCACAPYKPGDDRAAICNELNSKLIFNGNTSSIRRSEIQNAEDPLLRRQYEKYHCGQ